MSSSRHASESRWLERIESQVAAATGGGEAARSAADDEPLDRSTIERLYQMVAREARAHPAHAEKLARLAARAAELLDDDFGRALAAKAEGFLRHQAADYRQALELYERAATLFSRQGAEVDYAATLNTSLHTLSYLGLFDRAYAAAAEARRIFEAHGEELKLARLDSNEANTLFRHERIAEAQERCRSALRRLRELEAAPQDIAAAMHNVITCGIALHDFTGSLEVYDELMSYCELHGLAPVAAQAEYNIAYLYFLRGDYERSLELYREARTLAVEVGDRYHQALCDLDQAEMLLELNMRDEGGRLAAAALAAFEELGLGYEAGKALAFLAIAASQQGKAIEALELFRQAKLKFEREGNTAWVSIIDLYQAVIYHDERRPLEARQLTLAALAFFETSNLTAKALICELLLARVAQQSGNLGEARDRAASALRHAATVDRPALEFRAHLVTAQVAEADGEPDEALRHLDEAAALLEDLRSHLRGEDLKLAFLRDKNEVYEHLVWLTASRPLSTEDKRAVFLHMERAKSRTLADLVSFRAPVLPAAVPGHSRLVDQMSRLRNELNWYYRQIDLQEVRSASAEGRGTESTTPADPPGASPAGDRLARLQEESRRRERELTRSLAELRAANVEFGALHTAAIFDLDEVREAIPDGTMLLEYFVARDTVFCCCLGRSVLEVVPLTTGTLVREQQQRLSFQLGKFRLGSAYTEKFADTLQNSTVAHLEALEAELVAPLRRHIEAEHLIIVPHGTLHSLPFHAFRDERGYLLDEFSVSYAPSANVFALCSRKSSSRQTGGLVLGVATPDAPGITEEAEAIAAIVPRAELFLGEQATEERLRDEGARARLIHLATHGLFRQDNPMFSSIQLGASRLTLFDLYSLELDADLVVLSGCSTGVNVIEGGDELIGLSRGLLYAGASSVMASLWDVHDETTVRFMSCFYRSLLAGGSRAGSVRDAMRAVRETHPHPYYWAPFVLIGQSARVA